MDWNKLQTVGAERFVCGHCGNQIATDRGYSSNTSDATIYICPYCTKPTFFLKRLQTQTPGVAYGDEVTDLPDDVAALYGEARRCMSVSCYTAAVLACRKLLMHLAVDKGADEGKSFLGYVEYLDSKGYVPPDGHLWVDHIRKKGNETNHEISIMDKSDGQNLISFVGMLLKFIYEFPAKVPRE